MASPLMRFAGQLLFALPAQRGNTTDVRERLEGTGANILQRLQNAGDTPKARKTALHIIAIERWATNRLRMIAGLVPNRVDTSGEHAVPQATPWPELLALWRETRAATVALLPQLEGASTQNAHNAFGAWNAKTWLRYVLLHADMESKRAK